MRDMPTKEELHTLLEYDEQTGKLTWRYRPNGWPPWNARFSGKEAGNSDQSGYLRIAIGNRHFWAHRIIFKMMAGTAPPMIDHINEDRGDNRWANLREASRAENQRNRGANKNNASGFKGVYFSRAAGRYAAQIMAGGKAIYLGLHDTPEAASAAYAEAASRLHGEFAKAG